MPIGTCKFFDATKGYGFLSPDGGQKDNFVHISAVEKSGIGDLKQGDRVSYELQTERGRSAAVNLKRVA